MTPEQQHARKLRRLWIRSENFWTIQPRWVDALAGVDPLHFMTAKERRRFSRLPDVFTVYRGYQADAKHGLSFTLKRDVAEFYAARREHLPEGTVWERTIRKAEVFAYVDNEQGGSWGDHEIIILGSKSDKKLAHTVQG
jgi:hypothetical protein